jgi:hypothetical protein
MHWWVWKRWGILIRIEEVELNRVLNVKGELGRERGEGQPAALERIENWSNLWSV